MSQIIDNLEHVCPFTNIQWHICRVMSTLSCLDNAKSEFFFASINTVTNSLQTSGTTSALLTVEYSCFSIMSWCKISRF